MPLTVSADSPRSPQASALLRQSLAYLQSLYPPEENFHLSIDALCAPDILFFTAALDGQVVGTAALALRPDHAEVKSMFVAPRARGRGAAGALLTRLIAEAKARALPINLETGPRNTEALALYARHGFTRRGPFGGYGESPSSIFMERLVPRRLDGDQDMAPVHALLLASFAYMDGVIDPPSSMMRMTPDDLRRDAVRNELWVLGDGPLACMILTQKPGTLYLGKLAVAEDARGRGLSRVMVDHAVRRARALGLPAVTLQVRVELTRNQAAFRAMGFREVARTAHEGYARATSITFVRDL